MNNAHTTNDILRGDEDHDYLTYTIACEDEELEFHNYRMWVMLGRPSGPLG